MKRLRVAVLVCMLLSAALLGGTYMLRTMNEDNTMPEISVPSEVLEITAEEYSDETLLQGITAKDKKDGDISSRLHVQGVIRQDDGKMLVTYAVSDKDNNVSTATRTVECKDITAPRFKLSAPMVYGVGDTVQVLDRLSAIDALDGDVTDKIRVFSNGISLNVEGKYPITFEVTNSFGDTSRVTLNIQIKNGNPAAPVIRLSDYLVYAKANEKFTAEKYITEVVNGARSDVSIKLPFGGLKEGVNEITYTCKGANGSSGSTVLYVVVE